MVGIVDLDQYGTRPRGPRYSTGGINMWRYLMNKDRIQGSVEQAKGKVKEIAGKVTGDAKLETEGKTQQVAGTVQNAVGGFKDTVKKAVND